MHFVCRRHWCSSTDLVPATYGIARVGPPGVTKPSFLDSTNKPMDILQRFTQRVCTDWLTTYCSDRKRNYDAAGFNKASIRVAEADAKDCMLAIDYGVVCDTHGGRYRANMSTAQEVLFWEGHKTKSPRPITLWLEPVITFAALARLHLVHGWPKEQLGMQPKGWAFDLAAHEATGDSPPRILGEVKKSGEELRRLRADLLKLSTGEPAETVSINSAKKWKALLATKPAIVWLLAPNEESYVYAPSYSSDGCELREVEYSALAHSAA